MRTLFLNPPSFQGFDVGASSRWPATRLPGETPGTLRKTIDFAKRLDTETIQVSIAHALPGTELHQYGAQNGLINLSMSDDAGHQLPNITYRGLDDAELVDAVERFYGEYYFRPRVLWRLIRKAIFNSSERHRLAKEAREYLSLRSNRKRFVVEQRKAAAARVAAD